MLYDPVVVAVFVTTRRKLHSARHSGRWQKLVSGVVILVLGLVMRFRPEWLV